MSHNRLETINTSSLTHLAKLFIHSFILCALTFPSVTHAFADEQRCFVQWLDTVSTCLQQFWCIDRIVCSTSSSVDFIISSFGSPPISDLFQTMSCSRFLQTLQSVVPLFTCLSLFQLNNHVALCVSSSCFFPPYFSRDLTDAMLTTVSNDIGNLTQLRSLFVFMSFNIIPKTLGISTFPPQQVFRKQ